MSHRVQILGLLCLGFHPSGFLFVRLHQVVFRPAPSRQDKLRLCYPFLCRLFQPVDGRVLILGAAKAQVIAEVQMILGYRVPFLGSLPGQRKTLFLIQFNAVRFKVSGAQVHHGLHVSGRDRLFQKLQALLTVLRDADAIQAALAQISQRVR